MTEGELTGGALTDREPVEGPVREPKARRIRVVVPIGALGVGLLVGVGVIAYSTYADFHLTLQGLQTAYTAEQTAAKRLARRTEELSKALEQAQARVRSLDQAQKASEADRGKLEAKSTRLEMTLQGLQATYVGEMAAARKSTQKEEELTRTLEQAQARIRALEISQKVVEQEKSERESRSAKLETAVQGLQTAYASEQATTKKLTEKAEGLAKALEQVRARMRAREQPPDDLAELNHALGASYSKRGMNAEALKAFQTALEFDPNHAESHFDLARLYIGHFDDKRSAAWHLRRYLQLRPAAKDSERVRGWLMKVEKELDAEKERKGWGKADVNRGLERIVK